MSGEAVFVQFGTIHEELLKLQSTVIYQHQELIHANHVLMEQYEKIAQLKQQLQNLHVSSSANRKPRIADPELFSGNWKKAMQFLLQIRNAFNAQPLQFPSNIEKLARVVSFLCSLASAWVVPYLKVEHSILGNLEEFMEAFCVSFWQCQLHIGGRTNDIEYTPDVRN